jgi:hypothetical protein
MLANMEIGRIGLTDRTKDGHRSFSVFGRE